MLDTNQASTICVYDDANRLIFVMMALPSMKGESAFITCDAKDADFLGFVRNAGLKLFR